MLQKDKYKIILFASLAIIMAITFTFFGKESIVMKSVAGASLLIWIVGSKFIINKKIK